MTTRASHSAILVAVLVMLGGCAQKTASTPETTPAPTASAPAAPTGQPAAPEQRPAELSGPAAQAVAAGAPAAQTTASVTQSLDDFTEEPALKDVFFDPGRADIGRNGTKTMKDNVRWILENPGSLVLVEGHTDYKGNREGNIAMGERRAKAAVSVLLKEGVPDTRLYTVSLGSDHPVCAEKTDACAAKNRRVHFRVKKQ